MRTQTHFFGALLALSLGSLSFPPGAVPGPLPSETTLKVTVQYTGPGQVSPDRRIWIWLFDREPQPNPSAMVEPIAEQSLSVNGGVATFTGVAPRRVWVTVMYDAAGGFMGQAPPPSGSPAWAYLENNALAPVAPGPNASVQIVFNDQYRIP